MQVSVWDTYVQRSDGKTMHFDIIVPSNLTDEKVIFGYGQEFLNLRQIQSGRITTKECQFCHIEKATNEIIAEIQAKGYFILVMENCN